MSDETSERERLHGGPASEEEIEDALIEHRGRLEAIIVGTVPAAYWAGWRDCERHYGIAAAPRPEAGPASEETHADECPGCYYGTAPHYHDLSGGSIVGSTRLLPREEWPSNFTPDPEDASAGVYHCTMGCCTCSKEDTP